MQPAFLSTKCDNLCKELRLLQSETAYLLQSASAVSLRKNDNCCQERRFSTKCDSFFIKRCGKQSYYRVRQFLLKIKMSLNDLNTVFITCLLSIMPQQEGSSPFKIHTSTRSVFSSAAPRFWTDLNQTRWSSLISQIKDFSF